MTKSCSIGISITTAIKTYFILIIDFDPLDYKCTVLNWQSIGNLEVTKKRLVFVQIVYWNTGYNSLFPLVTCTHPEPTHFSPLQTRAISATHQFAIGSYRPRAFKKFQKWNLRISNSFAFSTSRVKCVSNCVFLF